MAGGKDTIYIDVDDEITTVIDKVRSSKEPIVALVLPKRATTFQSSVNMKLLKRTADQVRKKVVLITSEPSLLPLASLAGLHVADSLQSKPEVPNTTDDSSSPQASIDEAVPINQSDDFRAEKNANKSIGDLAAGAGMAVSSGKDDIETIPIEDASEEADAVKDQADKKDSKPKPNHKLHVPNFEKFRLGLILGVLLLVALVVGIYFALAVLPKATIAISTDTSSIPTSFALTLEPGISAVDTTNNTIPAQQQQLQKTYTQQEPATGQQNNGQVASGSVVLSAGSCSGTIPNNVASGTVVSTGGLNYITQSDAPFSPTLSNGHCFWQTNAIPINAQSAGAKYNVSDASFTVAGNSSLSGTGSAGGGTDNIVTVVSQNDINSAEQKLTGQSSSSVQQTLTQELQQDGLYAISGTFTSTTPSYSSDAQAGDAASNVTVTENITYSMYGAKQSFLDNLIQNQVQQKINPKKQSILSDGLSSATFKLTNSSNSSATVSLSTNVIAGPNLNVASIKKQVAGMKSGDVKSLLSSYQGVTKVTVHLSPFWVSSVPKNTSKITINLSKPVVSNNASA